MHVVGYGLNDFRLIRADMYANRFTVHRMIQEHKVALEFLRKSVKPGDVVVSHHGPTWLSVAEQYQRNHNGGFVSELSEMILDLEPALWFHGHVHQPFDYKVGDTRVLCNPHGYADENPNFDLYKYVRLD